MAINLRIPAVTTKTNAKDNVGITENGVVYSGDDILFTRFRRKVKIAVFSDSFGAYDAYYANGILNMSENGIFHILFAMLGHERFDVVTYAGIQGQTAELLANRYSTDIYPVDFDILFGCNGANDFFLSPFYTAQQVYDRVIAIIDDALSRNKLVYWCTAALQGSGRTNFTAARQLESMKYSQMLRDAKLTRPGLRLIDLSALMRDSQDVTNYGPQSDCMTSDGVHITNTLATRVGRAYYDELNALLPILPRPFSHADGVATPWSNSLLAVGLGQMVGTSGTKNTGVTGTVPTGWSCTATASATVVGSTETDRNGDWFVGDVTVAAGTSTNQNIQFFTTSSFHSLIDISKAHQVMSEMWIDSTGGVQLISFVMRLFATVNGAGKFLDFNAQLNGATNYNLDGLPLLLKPIGHPVKYTNNPTATYVYFYVTVKNTDVTDKTLKFKIRNVKPFPQRTDSLLTPVTLL